MPVHSKYTCVNESEYEGDCESADRTDRFCAVQVAVEENQLLEETLPV